MGGCWSAGALQPAEPPGEAQPESALIDSGPVPPPRRFIIYPDFDGYCVEEVVVRRVQPPGGAGAARWVTDHPVAGSKTRGYWTKMQSAVAANEWDLLWKPTGDFSFMNSAAVGGGRAGLHSIPLPQPFRLQLVNHAPFSKAMSSKGCLWLSLQLWNAALDRPTTTTMSASFVLTKGRAAAVRAALEDVTRAGSAASTAASGAVSMPPAHTAEGIWVLKPDHAYGGQGVEVLTTAEVLAFIDAQAAQEQADADADAAAAAAAAAVAVVPAASLAGAATEAEPEAPAAETEKLQPSVAPTTIAGVAVAGPVVSSAHVQVVVNADSAVVSAAVAASAPAAAVAPPPKQPARKGRDAEWVVQKYLERPLLLGGRKFDIRVNVLITDAWDVYVYRDVLIKMAGQAYSFDRPAPAASTDAPAGAAAGSGAAAPEAAPATAFSKQAHITNSCFQSDSATFGAKEPGNFLSLEQMQTYLDLSYGRGFLDARRDLYPRWVELILDALSSVRLRCMLKVNHAPQQQQGAAGGAGAAAPFASGLPPLRRWFELFGFDILVDEHFRSWLIEANTSPGFTAPASPYATTMFARMLEEMAQVAIDPVFTPPASRAHHHQQQVAGVGGAAAGAASAPAGAARASVLPAAFYDVDSVLSWANEVVPQAPPAWARPPPPAGGAGDDALPAVGAAAAASVRPAVSWERVWTEDASVDLAAIPHQAAMRARGALNTAAVDRVLAEPTPPPPSEVLAMADAHGLRPLLEAIAATTPALTPSVAAEVPQWPTPDAALALAASVAWKPVLRRYIPRADAAWLYPVGVPPVDEAGLVVV